MKERKKESEKGRIERVEKKKGLTKGQDPLTCFIVYHNCDLRRGLHAPSCMTSRLSI